MTKRKTKPASPARTKLEELKTEHDRDLAALAAAKAIEASIIKKCVSVQLDEKTTIIAHADHIDGIIKRYKQKVPSFNPKKQIWKQ